MNTTAERWAQLYNQTALCDVPRHFAGIRHSQFMTQYLATVLHLCPRGGKTLETGIGSGYGAIWLSLRGIEAEGIDYSPEIVERARQINNILGGSAIFFDGDLFQLFNPPESSFRDPRGSDPRHHGSERYSSPKWYNVIHHQGVLEHFAVPWIHAALAQQVVSADWVVFSVPSVYYPFDPEFGDERLLPLEEWERILSPFSVEELKYYGDPQNGEKEQILCTLRGQEISDELLTLMCVPKEPYPDGISAVVHTRNETRHIRECLQTLQGWTDEIIVCDMESMDDTVAIAREFTPEIVHHPLISNFDRARNVSAMRAKYKWVFYLDADERVPPALGTALRDLTRTQGDNFEAIHPPFRHFFAGHWLQCLYPGYTAPRLFKNGRFFFNPRLHSGAQVDGRAVLFPADDPDVALQHYSFESLAHYLDKLNRYTDGEAANMHRDGQPYHWQHAIRHFVSDFQGYYDWGGAKRDGVHGFIYSFLSAFYRFEQHAKLYERRYREGQLQPAEQAVPQSVEEMLEYALRVVREKRLPQAPAIKVENAVKNAQVKNEPGQNQRANNNGERQSGIEQAKSEEKGLVRFVWCGPVLDPSGYGEQSRHHVLGLTELGYPLAVQPIPWSYDEVELPPAERKQLDELAEQPVAPGFIQLVHNFPTSFARHPQAGAVIGRTVFETDRLPCDWVKACNRMDAIWVPSSFNRETFAHAGVDPRKLVVIPESLDAASYKELVPGSSQERDAPPHAIFRILEDGKRAGHFAFLTVFDWTLHKGWDVLLRGFLEAFEGREDVLLVLKVWSTMNYSAQDIREQAAAYIKREIGHDLLQDHRIIFVQERLSHSGLQALYQLCDSYVLPSRGEGWGRPYMEAMACGKPTIATNWSGNTAFMSQENSYLINYHLTAVPEVGWREIPTYKGHRWAEPDREHLKELMRRIVDERSEAQSVGQQAREHVLSHFDRREVARQIITEIERMEEEVRSHPISVVAYRMNTTEAGPTEANTTDRLSDLDVPEQEQETSRLILPPASLIVLPDGLQPAEGRPAEEQPFDAVDAHGWRQQDDQKAPRKTSLADEQHEQHNQQEVSTAPVRVRWEGAQFVWHSLAYVNRELCLGLLESGAAELSVIPSEPLRFTSAEDTRFPALESRFFAPLESEAQIHVRHFFPPRLDPPEEGHFVLIQPWEYGYLPQRWIEPIRESVSEVWCYSKYVRDVYLASGIDEEKLHLVPLGVDAQVFHPEAPPYVFTTEPGAAALSLGSLSQKQNFTSETTSTGRTQTGSTQNGGGLDQDCGDKARFVFLFAGGTLHRKGIDILLDAYHKAFTSLDDVCLVIKDTGTKGVYYGQNEQQRILGLVNDSSRPPIVYLDEDLSPHQLAGVYTVSDCLVQPYRGEGFCLPALEAMACGIPVIVPEGGPTDDFVDETVGWRVKAQKHPFSIAPSGNGVIGQWECTGPTWNFEVAVDDLARLMRNIYHAQGEARRRGANAVLRVQERWTWEHSTQKVLERLTALQQKPITKAVNKNIASSTSSASISAERRHVKEVLSKKNGVQSTLHDQMILAPETPLIILPLGSQTKPKIKMNSADENVAKRQFSTISLCMIVKNEERVLGACLESIKPYVDEIIVVDTGSTDRTVSIAKEHGAQVFHFPWCDSFSAARNVSLQHATGEWILWMDADDTIPPECGKKLHELAAIAEDRTTGFLMQVHIPPAPGENGFTVVDHVKLFRNLPNLRFEGRIHEQILESIYRVGGRVERSDLYVVHSGYDYSVEGQAKKRERDLLLLSKDLEERPDHPFVLFNIGMTAYHLKDYGQAVPALERCLQVSKPQESTVRKVYAMLAGCHLEQGGVEQARTTIEQGLHLFPHDPELLFRAGIVYRESGNLAAAEQAYVKLLTNREVGHIDSLDVSMTGYKAHHNLALIYQDMGRWQEAEAQWQEAVQNNTHFTPSWLGLGELYLKQRRIQDVKHIISQLRSVDPASSEALEQRTRTLA